MVFRVGLATRNDYMVSHERRRILRWEGDLLSSYSCEDVISLGGESITTLILSTTKAKAYEEGLPSHVT